MWTKDLLVVAIRVAGVVVFLHGLWVLFQAIAWRIFSAEEEVLTDGGMVFHVVSQAAYCALGLVLALGAVRIASWFDRSDDGSAEVPQPPPMAAAGLRAVARYVLGLYAIILSVRPLGRLIWYLTDGRAGIFPEGWGALVAVAAYGLFAFVMLAGPARVFGRVGTIGRGVGRSLRIEEDPPPEETASDRDTAGS